MEWIRLYKIVARDKNIQIHHIIDCEEIVKRSFFFSRESSLSNEFEQSHV